MQPARARRAPADRPGTAGEHEGGDLEGVVVLVVGVSQGRAANPPDHGAVVEDQSLEGRLRDVAPPRQVAVEELGVGQRPDRPGLDPPPHPPHPPVRRTARHAG